MSIFMMIYSYVGMCVVVVWNPWEEKACGMSDFGDDEVSWR